MKFSFFFLNWGSLKTMAADRCTALCGCWGRGLGLALNVMLINHLSTSPSLIAAEACLSGCSATHHQPESSFSHPHVFFKISPWSSLWELDSFRQGFNGCPLLRKGNVPQPLGFLAPPQQSSHMTWPAVNLKFLKPKRQHFVLSLCFMSFFFCGAATECRSFIGPARLLGR